MALAPRRIGRLQPHDTPGLAFVANRQREDGSFEAPDAGQPAITALGLPALSIPGQLLPIFQR